jgi:hypothetical protein
MKKQQFPLGWDQNRVEHLVANDGSLTDEKQVDEDKTAVSEQKGKTVITVPKTLPPAIRKLLAGASGK